MPSWLERLSEDIRNLWEKLPTSQRWFVASVAGALILALMAVSATMFIVPSGELFMGDLSRPQMADATNFLEENNITYDIGEDDSSIYVYDDAKKLQFEYAAARGTKTLGGNRVLMGPHWSQTKEQFDEISLRALEEELAATIERGGNIEWARVHLTRRGRALFPSNETKATASVSVKSKSGEVSRNEVEGIQWLVANALPGLDPVNVKVIGDGNRPLEGFMETSESEQVANEQRKAELMLEKKKNAAIAEILNPILGGSENYTSSVILELDYDKLEIEETILDTEEPLAIRIQTQESSEETTQTGGVPGTPENNPADRLGRNVGTGSESNSSEEMSEREYRPRLERKQSRVVAPGAIVSQHVSVAINQRETLQDGEVAYEARTPEELAMLENQLKAAVGHVDASAEYHFVLNEISFDTTGTQIAATEEKRRLFFRQLDSGLFLAAAILMIAVFFYFMRKVFTEAEDEEIVEEEVHMPDGPKTLAELGLRDLSDDESLEPEDQKNKMLREQVEQYATESPETVAEIIKNWLSE